MVAEHVVLEMDVKNEASAHAEETKGAKIVTDIRDCDKLMIGATKNPGDRPGSVQKILCPPAEEDHPSIRAAEVR